MDKGRGVEGGRVVMPGASPAALDTLVRRVSRLPNRSPSFQGSSAVC